ncbi:unnamed protein product [Aphanomyces euteiches]
MSDDDCCSFANYSFETNASVTEFSVNALINAGLNQKVSVPTQFAFICIVTVFVLCFEFILESIEHVIARHPTYWRLLNKMYRELLVGGLTAFVSKRLDQWNVMDETEQNKLNIGDEMVLYFALSIAIQSALIFTMLRKRNQRADKLSALNSRDLLEYMTTDKDAKPRSLSSQSIMKNKILQNFFLTTYKLPDMFSFPKYLRSIQDSEIFSLFDVEIIEWLLLVATYSVFFRIADDLEIRLTIDENASDEAIEAGIEFGIAKGMLENRLKILLGFILLLSATIWALDWFLRRLVRDIVTYAANGQESYLEALREVADQEDARLAKPMTNDEAISTMMELADSLSDVKDHSSIWDLIKSAARRLVGRAHVKTQTLEAMTNLNLRFFSRKAVHVFAKLLLAFNAMYFALVWATFNASLVPVITSQEATMYPVWLAGLMAILIVNMVYFAPRLVRQLALVNATVRVNPNELKTVIEHFADVLEMQTEMAEAINEYCDANDKDAKELEQDMVALDPQGTGYIEGEDLRNIIIRYGFKFSANKFQTFVRLQFKTRGTKVPYADFCRILFGLTDQLKAHHGALSEFMTGRNLNSQYLHSLRRGGTSDSMHSNNSSNSSRRTNRALLYKLAGFQRGNTNENADSASQVYHQVQTPNKTDDALV